ncbi:MAG: 30S ribosomal protein S16 [Planctomycetes bacterium]|nr:30S ribosomal protein S16 [Planctomycetota bacterium]
MAVKIRMTRIGRRHRPFFRINAVDGRTPRDGKILEKLGHYDPLEKDADKQVVIDLEKVKVWLDKGAVPSETVAEILAKRGLMTKYLEEKRVRRARAKAQAKKKGKLFAEADRVAAVKKAEADKLAVEEAKKAAEEAAKAAKAAETEAPAAE